MPERRPPEGGVVRFQFCRSRAHSMVMVACRMGDMLTWPDALTVNTHLTEGGWGHSHPGLLLSPKYPNASAHHWPRLVEIQSVGCWKLICLWTGLFTNCDRTRNSTPNFPWSYVAIFKANCSCLAGKKSIKAALLQWRHLQSIFHLLAGEGTKNCNWVGMGTRRSL